MGKNDFVTFEEAMARDWLNQQIKIHEMQKASYVLNGVAALMTPSDRIHMLNGIVYITELLGLEMKERFRTDVTDYPWEYSFEYSGTVFYQISEERLGKYAETAE